MMNLFRIKAIAGVGALALFFGAVVGCDVNRTQGARDDSTKGEGAKKGEESSKPNVEFRLAETKPSEGLVAARAPGWPDPIYLHKDIEIMNADIKEAIVGLTPDEVYQVNICFTKSGGEKMARLSDLHRGKILAILIDGDVVFAPVMREKITGYASITGGLTRDDAYRLAKRFNSK